MNAKAASAKGHTESIGKKGLRALRRAVRNVRAENHRLGLPLIVWRNGRVAESKS